MNFPMPLGFLSRGAAAFDPNVFVALNDRVGALATWNPADKNANISLSGGNLIATSASAANHKLVRATHAPAAKAYWELDPNGSMGPAASVYVTIIGAMIGGTSVADGQYMTISGQGCAQGYSNDAANSYLNGWTGTVPNGIGNTIHALCFDPVGGKFWIGTGNAWWAGDPWAGTAMFARSAAAAPMFPGMSWLQNVTFTANFGASPWKSALASIVGPRQGGANCSFLSHCEGVSGPGFPILDAGTPPHYVASSAGTAVQFDTTKFKFGTSSLKFTPTATIYAQNGGAELAFGVGSFTVDCWFYLNTISGNQTICSFWPNSGTSYFSIFFDSSNTKLTMYNHFAGYVIVGTVNVPAGVWHHFAVTRAAGTTRLFLNGFQQGSWSDSTDYLGYPQRPLWGLWGDGVSWPLNGNLDETRILKGVAAWTSDFTPPTAPYS